MFGAGGRARARVTCRTSHCPRRPLSWSRDQMLCILPACSGWLLLSPHVHWCFSIWESYTRPANATQPHVRQRLRPLHCSSTAPLHDSSGAAHFVIFFTFYFTFHFSPVIVCLKDAYSAKKTCFLFNCDIHLYTQSELRLSQVELKSTLLETDPL